MAEAYSSCCFQRGCLSPCSPALLLRQSLAWGTADFYLASLLAPSIRYAPHLAWNTLSTLLSFLKLITSASVLCFTSLNVVQGKHLFKLLMSKILQLSFNFMTLHLYYPLILQMEETEAQRHYITCRVSTNKQPGVV